MKKKTWLLNLMLLFVSLFICFIITEISLRILLFGNISFLNDIPILAKQRDPSLYADSNSEDDFFNLAFNLNRKSNQGSCKRRKIHPLLGKIGNFSPDDYLHNNTKFISSRRPILLYGDSFAHGAGNEAFYQDILNTDKEFSQNHYLLNYGVGGYGLDQTYLLFNKSVDLYDNPFVVISLMTEDLDRSSLTHFAGPKPNFKIINNKLVLERPLIPDPHNCFLKYPTQINSYIYRRILHSRTAKLLLPNQFISFLKGESHYMQKKITINEKIILQIIKELKAKKLDYIFLIFHHGGNLYEDDWRDSFLKQILTENKISYIWSKKIILEHDEEINAPLFIPGDGHPATAYNKLIAEEIKRHVLKAHSTGLNDSDQ